MHAELIWPVETALGEGPLWLPEEGALWFVDIKRGRLHRYTPATDARESFDVGGAPSFAVPLAEGGLLIGRGLELVRFDGDTLGAVVAPIAMPAGNRTNDAAVDPHGRLWFGTMDDSEAEASGRIYRFDGTVREMGGAAIVTNGPAVSPDGTLLYHVDTIAGRIWRVDLRDDPGSIAHGELFVAIDPADGHPDGVVVDAEGCLWVALWGGWGVRRYSPAGELLLQVSLPCAQVTKIALGGPDLTTAYVTTARVGLSDAELEGQPLAGGLFAFAAPAPGVAPNAVRLG